MGWRRYAVFVDAGYLLAAGAWATVGSYRRAESRARIPELVSWLQRQAGSECEGRELLRLYWYDAANRREPDAQHREVWRQPDTKIRLGSINRYGQQKGVDALLLADMLDLALSRTVDTVVLVSGDEDLLEAVRRVQAQGLRVLLWGVDTPNNTLSVELRYEADRWRLLSGDELRPFFERVGGDGHAREAGGEPLPPGPEHKLRAYPPPPVVKPKWMEVPLVDGPAGPPLPTAGDRPVTYAEADPRQAALAAQSFVDELVQHGTDLSSLLPDRPQIPPVVDAKLLRYVIRTLEVAPDDQLDFDARTAMRNGFWAEVDKRVTH